MNAMATILTLFESDLTGSIVTIVQSYMINIDNLNF